MNPNQQRNRKRAIAFFLVAAVLIFWNLMQNASDSRMIRVACVGDSLTFGNGVEERKENCYPVQLQKRLGTEAWRVGNFGVKGAAVQKKSDRPYGKEERYEDSLEYGSDYVVLLLGTNDARTKNWKDAERFIEDYKELIEAYQKTSKDMKVILLTPPAVQAQSVSIQGNLVDEIRQTVEKIGKEENLPVLDLYTLSEVHPEWYNKDGVYLNKDGAKAIADLVYDQIHTMAENKQK